MDKKQAKFKLKIDIQCGVCGSLIHHPGGEVFPKFCPCCGGALERFCLKCHKKADMFFEEWWPEDDECVRTYSPAKRCTHCNAKLEKDSDEPDQGRYQN